MATAAELRQLLKEDSTGKNLYDHLTETLMRLVLDRPANAYDTFELISADVKANPMNPDPSKGRGLPPSPEEVSQSFYFVILYNLFCYAFCVPNIVSVFPLNISCPFFYFFTI